MKVLLTKVALWIRHHRVSVFSHHSCQPPQPKIRSRAVVLAGVLQECVSVYLLEAESRLRCEDPPHEVPSEGKLR
uniref:Uncharacterized protein n=1 Tax=Sinocyclocheilus grahami TaxID=75366 RepID=A0A672M9P2_SINGR